MKKHINLWLIASILFGLVTTACDKIDLDNINNTVSIKSNKKVLIEDFTGHTCVNCPTAHEELHKLMEAYGDTNLFAVAIHAGGFSNAQNPPSPFSYNFQTEAGNAYNDEFKPQAFPIGMVNRKTEGGTLLQDVANWGTLAANTFEQAAPLNITAEVTGISNSNTISGKVNLSFLADFTTEAKLQIIITEDSIIKPQLTHEGVNQNYVHMHVMRSAVNGIWGEALPQSQYATCDNESISFNNYSIGEDWKLKDLNIIAYVYDANSKEIIQVNGCKVMPKDIHSIRI